MIAEIGDTQHGNHCVHGFVDLVNIHILKTRKEQCACFDFTRETN